MAIPKTTITGTILNPNGDPMPGGTIEFVLSTGTGTVPDDATAAEYVVGGIETAGISVAGAVNFTLVPNDEITPAGTVWRATYKFPGHIIFQELWSITGAGTTVQIGDVVRSNVGSVAGCQKFIIVEAFNKLPNPPPASYRGVRAYVLGVSGEQDREYVAMKGWDTPAVYRWVPALEGGGP